MRMTERGFSAEEVFTLSEVEGETRIMGNVLKVRLFRKHIPYLKMMLQFLTELQVNSEKMQTLVNLRKEGLTKLINKLGVRDACTLITSKNKKNLITVY